MVADKTEAGAFGKQDELIFDMLVPAYLKMRCAEGPGHKGMTFAEGYLLNERLHDFDDIM